MGASHRTSLGIIVGFIATMLALSLFQLWVWRWLLGGT